MERLYELLAHALESFSDYAQAKKQLEKLVQNLHDHPRPFTSLIEEKEDGLHIIFTLQGLELDLIQLYRGDNDSAFLNVSPPDDDTALDVQLILLDDLILFFKDGVNP